MAVEKKSKSTASKSNVSKSTTPKQVNSTAKPLATASKKVPSATQIVAVKKPTSTTNLVNKPPAKTTSVKKPVDKAPKKTTSATKMVSKASRKATSVAKLVVTTSEKTTLIYSIRDGSNQRVLRASNLKGSLSAGEIRHAVRSASGNTISQPSKKK